MITLKKRLTLHKNTNLKIDKDTITKLKENANFCINILGQDGKQVMSQTVIVGDVYKQQVKLTIAQLFQCKD